MQRLVDAGAIPLGVTNTSELTLWIESENPVYGRTNNPYDRRRTAGGSSGGEGAAVGAGGSVFGVGADIGGSIRVPALFCGVFGHKPTPGLIPNTGIWPDTSGEAEQLLARRAADAQGRGPACRCFRSWPDRMAWISRPSRMELGDPATVSLDGLPVTLVEAARSGRCRADLRDARERAAGALASAGAQVRNVSLPSWRKALLPFLAALQNTGTDSHPHNRAARGGRRSQDQPALAAVRPGQPHAARRGSRSSPRHCRARSGAAEPAVARPGAWPRSSSTRSATACCCIRRTRRSRRRTGAPTAGRGSDPGGRLQPGRRAGHRGAARAQPRRAAGRRPGRSRARRRPPQHRDRTRARGGLRRLGAAGALRAEHRRA